MRSEQEADRIAEAIDDIADGIARRSGAPVRPHHVGAFTNTPDKQCLTEVAGLLRDSFAARKIDQAADSECRVHGKTRSRLAASLEAALQQIVQEDPWLFQIRIEIVQTIMHGARHDRLHSLGDWAQHFLIHRQNLAIGVLVRILER
ncbi:MAG TPA: hypothetical protein VI077_09055, partial [Pseudolabrys sp.]